MPALKWSAVIVAVLASALIALVARALFDPAAAALASLFGLVACGYLAGKWANTAHAYHGALVGAGYIALEAIGVIPTASFAGDAFADTLEIILLDGAVLVSATIGGLLARVSSSSGTGTAS
jgi:hypothetical protein